MSNSRGGLGALLAIAGITVAMSTGCVSQAVPSSSAAPTAEATTVPQASSAPVLITKPAKVARPSTKNSKSETKSATKPVAPKTGGAGQKTADPTVAAAKATPSPQPKASTKENQTPKTWPKKSRSGKAVEKKATNAFVAETQQMSAPEATKKTELPNAPLPEPPDYKGIATGAALGELQAQFLEYANNNWQQTGEVIAVGEPKVEDLIVDGIATHRVFICLDSSSLQVSEPDGFVVTPKVPAGTRTALNIYDLREVDGQLVVVNHQFPEDPNC